MVGLVVVSHSRELAHAAVGLARQMLSGQPVPIVVAAGLDDGSFGTDAVAIQQALLEADPDGDGVVVLMDLGSAVLSAELALELLEDDDARARVLLCPAPLVEGLVLAAVTAQSGADREQVAAEALGSLAGKQSQLQPPPSTGAPAPAPPDPAPASPLPTQSPLTAQFEITAEHGLHARPAARLVRLLQDGEATVELRNLSTHADWVPGSSLSRLATLGALRGHKIEVRAAGPDAAGVLAQLLSMAEDNFGDPAPSPSSSPAPTPPLAPTSTANPGPLPASPGIGIGPAVIRTGRPLARFTGPDPDAFDPANPANPADPADPADPAREQHALDEAITAVRAQIDEVRVRVARDLGEDEAAIFDAHLALLADPEIVAAAGSRISAGAPATRAWAESIGQVDARYQAIADPYLQARAADVRAVGDQVLTELLGRHPTADTADTADTTGGPDHGGGSGPDERTGVLVAADLTPAQAATLDPDRITAVVLAFGSPTAHSAILARARGIPAVVGAGPQVLKIAEGTVLAVDGGSGELVINPSDAVLAQFRARSQAGNERRRLALAQSAGPASTADGVLIQVGANVGSVEDARAAAAFGADLIGLVRTEFLFLGRRRAPDIEEQESVYRELAQACPGRRIILRTLDVGGDKPLAYLPMPAEANPFLGVRGIRLALHRPRLLADQLFAIVRVAHDVPVSVMFPMVSTLDELISARRFLDEAIRQVGSGPPAGLRVGIMIEVPAAALKAATFAPYVDFLSIGTNDLTQYALAAERGNDAVALLGDPLDPGVLKLIDATCRGAGPATVAVCGELAADEKVAAVLAGLGVRELSVLPAAVPGVKQAVRDVVLEDAEVIAWRALTQPSAGAVRELLAGGR